MPVAVLLALLLTGCKAGVRWDLVPYPEAQAKARAAGQATFVYFRSWYLVECTEFEEKILKDPDVLAETRDMVCVPLDFRWDRPLARKWGLTRVPALAITAPDGELLARQQAPITREELLAALRAAKQTMARPRPSATPPASQ